MSDFIGEWKPAGLALLPVRMICGRLAWLRRVERRWNWNLNPWGYYEYSGTDGGFEYRAATQDPNQ